jgi:hypothetical protein
VGTVYVLLGGCLRHGGGEYFIKTLVAAFKSRERD